MHVALRQVQPYMDRHQCWNYIRSWHSLEVLISVWTRRKALSLPYVHLIPFIALNDCMEYYDMLSLQKSLSLKNLHLRSEGHVMNNLSSRCVNTHYFQMDVRMGDAFHVHHINMNFSLNALVCWAIPQFDFPSHLMSICTLWFCWGILHDEALSSSMQSWSNSFFNKINTINTECLVCPPCDSL